jgi:hypothetical protein
LQENRRRNPYFRQIRSPQFQQFLLPVNRFGLLHGRLITCEIDRTIVVITLNRPDKLNAYTGAMERKRL